MPDSPQEALDWLPKAEHPDDVGMGTHHFLGIAGNLAFVSFFLLLCYVLLRESWLLWGVAGFLALSLAVNALGTWYSWNTAEAVIKADAETNPRRPGAPPDPWEVKHWWWLGRGTWVFIIVAGAVFLFAGVVWR